jgi:integrase
LHTSDLRRAERLAVALDGQIGRLFAAAANIVGDGGGEDVVTDDSNVVDGQELIERLCDSYLRRLLAEDRVSRQSGRESGDVEGALLDIAEDYAEDYADNRVEIVEDAAQQLLSSEQVDLSDEQLRALLGELLRTRVVAVKASIAERAGDAAFDPRSVQLQRTSASALAPDVAAAHTVGELAESYVKHQRETEAWKKGRGADDRAKSVQRFVEWFGADTPLSDVDPKACEGVFEMFRERRLVATTTNKELRLLRAFFNYAIKIEWLTRNPAKELKVKEPSARDQRDPFSSGDLRQLFGESFHKVSVGRMVAGNRKLNEKSEIFMPERYWCPLLSLLAGLRQGEAVRLRVENFETIDGVLCIAPDPEEGKTLKTDASKRVVPVHAHLVDLGLMDFVEEQRAAGEKFLFPRATGLKKPEGALADWFPKYRARVGVSGKKKTFHSLRHNFSQGLADAGAQDSAISDLMGHADGSMSTGRYGGRASVDRLRDSIELLDFREELSGLTKPTKP